MRAFIQGELFSQYGEALEGRTAPLQIFVDSNDMSLDRSSNVINVGWLVQGTGGDTLLFAQLSLRRTETQPRTSLIRMSR